MSKQWAEDEAKLGFSGPPAEIGWADHEETVRSIRNAYENTLKDIEWCAYDALNETPIDPYILDDSDERGYQRLRHTLNAIWTKAREGRSHG